jgi:hypothetical protein
MLLEQMLGELRPLMDAGIAVNISSSPGAGKTDSIVGPGGWVDQQSEKDGFEWGVSHTMLATQTPVDLMGYLIPGTREWKDELTGTTHTTRVSEFTLPYWAISTKGIPLSQYKRALIILDEADKADSDTFKTSAEIQLKASIGPHQHDPRKVGRIILMNRAQDRSGSGRKFDFIINRVAEFEILSSFEGWRDNYALKVGMDPLFIAFASKYPEVVFSNKVPDKQGSFCTARSLTNLAKVLPLRVTDEGKIKIDSVTNEIINGMIGTAAGMQLSAWIKLRHETPDWEDILKDPAGIGIQGMKPDAMLMVCYECAHKVTTATAAKCVTFIKRLPAQFSVTFAKAAVKRNYDLINTPAFMDWVAKNASLLNAIGGAK